MTKLSLATIDKVGIEGMAGVIISGIIIIVFIGLGFVLMRGKGACLIAGYNTMPEDEKAKYDVIALCKFMGKMMFLFAFSMVFWVFSEILEQNWLFVVGIILFIGTMLFLLIYTNTKNRFKHKQD